jgi:hypothetical protein
VQLARDLTVFEKADSDRIRQSLLDYERAAVADWTPNPQAAIPSRRPITPWHASTPHTNKSSRATIFNGRCGQ